MLSALWHFWCRATSPTRWLATIRSVFELIFRPLWAFLLLAIFIWLLTVGDHIEEHRIAAQGLPRTRGWLKQFVLGILMGCVR